MITYTTKGRGQPLARQYYRGPVLIGCESDCSAKRQDAKQGLAEGKSAVRSIRPKLKVVA